MLARDNRLRKAHEITRVYKRGTYGGGGAISVKAAASGRSQTRAVVVVGKKVSKRAVVRNRLRRRLLGDLKSRWATVRAGYDIVVTVHHDLSELSSTELRQQFAKALERAGAITT